MSAHVPRRSALTHLPRRNALTHLPRRSALAPTLALAWACGPAVAEEERSAELAAGTSIEIRLDDTVSTRSTAVGAAINGAVSRPVIYEGKVVVPEGAVVSGTVTAISRVPPVLSAVFDQLDIGGAVYPLSGVVSEAALQPQSEMRDEAAKIGGGAAAGAVIGGVVGGDVKSAAIGAAAGAAAGTGVAIATKEKWAVLPAGSRLTVRLDEALPLPLDR